MKKVKWLEDAVFYNIYPQSFYDTNDDGIGDLNGITEKLSYIKDMGFSAIWLNPFYVSPFNDAGYDVTDFYKVAPRYGTNDDFENLAKSAHDLGLKVIVDLVAGHTSMECEWFKKSMQSEENEYSNRYIWTNHWCNTYNGSCIAGASRRDGCYMKNFFYCQPALNYGFAKIEQPEWQLPPEHPDCRATKQELINIMEYWIDLGCDGFRVDMAASVIKNDYDGSVTRAFWNEIRDIFDKKYPECVLISEWSNPKEAINAGFHIDFLIHFCYESYTSLFRSEKYRNINNLFLGNSFFTKEGNGHIERFLEDYLREYELTKDKGYISIPTGNHDLHRIAYGRTKEELEVVYTFIMTMPGVPFVYYGDEIGMKYIEGLSKEGGFNRTGSRTPMQWNNGKNHGFSNADADKLYLPTDPSDDAPNVEDQLKDEGSLLNTTKNLIKIRKSSKALSAEGDIEFLNRKYGGYPLIYKRFYGDEKYIICINPTDKAMDYDICIDFETVFKNKDFSYNNGKLSLAPVSSAILKIK